MTGGNFCLGREMALALPSGGPTWLSPAEKRKLEEVAEEIKALGRKAIAYGCHVAKWDEIEGLVEKAYGSWEG